MPVLGHAFVGLATASCFQPRDRRRIGAALWVPILVGLAYLPDICGQLTLLVFQASWRPVTHSIWFALMLSPLLAIPLAKATGLSSVASLGIVLLSFGMHDGLDLLQGTDPQPFAPLSDWSIPMSRPLLPQSMRYELLVFAAPCLLFSLGCAAWRRRQGNTRRREPLPRAQSFLGTASVALTVLVFLLAAGTHYLRTVRIRELDYAVRLIGEGDPAAALDWVDQAERWPASGLRGRTDFARGKAYLALGDRARAEQCFLQGVVAAPQDCWLLLDLARFYAVSERPLPERRARTQPVLAELRRRFPNEPSIAFHVSVMEKQLGVVASRTGE